ncbi:GGDEF domain-containing protein [Veronia pacifica]|nr:GGDEF domain-containing protein [Veronia pacifica]
MRNIKTSWYFYFLIIASMVTGSFILYPSLVERYENDKENAKKQIFSVEKALQLTEIGRELSLIRTSPDLDTEERLRQLEKIDAENILQSNPLLYASFLLVEIEAFLRGNDRDGVEEAREKAWNYCQSSDQKWLCARVLTHKSYDNLRLGQYDLAQKNLNEALPYAEESNDLHALMTININFTTVHLQNQKLATAKYYLSKAENYERRLPEPGVKSIIQGLKAMLAIRFEDWDNAEYYLKLGLDDPNIDGSPLELSTNVMHYFNLIFVEAKRNNLEQAWAYLDKARDIIDQMGDSGFEGFYKTVEASIYLDEGKLDSAYQSINDALSSEEFKPFVYDYSSAQLTKADILLAMNKIEEAKELYLTLLNKKVLAKDISHQAVIYKSLSDAYERKGDIQSAYNFLKKHYNARFEYEQSMHQDEMDKISIEYYEGVKEREITILKTERALKASKLAREQMQNNVLVVVVLLILFFVFNQIRRLRKMKAVNESLLTSNSKLNEEANKDSLTGLRNRRFLSHYLEQLTTSPLATGLSFTIGILDLDDFKHFNDDYGHNIGDLVLIEAAKRLQKAIRREDTLVRWGGEEFLCVLQDTDSKNIDIVMDRLCKSVGSTPFIIGDLSLNVTLTMGAVNHIPVSKLASDWPSILHRADVELYKAKQEGKNKYRSVSAANKETEIV